MLSVAAAAAVAPAAAQDDVLKVFRFNHPKVYTPVLGRSEDIKSLRII